MSKLKNFLGNSNQFFTHKIIEEDGGYNYFFDVHITGLVLVTRENISTEEFKYANGGFDLSSAISNRVSLDYKNINEL